MKTAGLTVVRKTKLLAVPGTGWQGASPDGSRQARVVIMTPDAGRPARRVTTSPNNPWPDETPASVMAVIVDGKKGKVYSDVNELSVTWSPDSKRVAYVATAEPGKCCAVIDGAEGPTYSAVLTGGGGPVAGAGVLFSPDSRRTAYVGVAQMYVDYVVVNGKTTGGPYFEVKNLTFSPDSQRVAYVACVKNANVWTEGRPQDKQTTFSVVIDGKAGPEHPWVQNGPVFSPDGKHVAYTARENDSFTVYLDGAPGKSYRDISGPPVFTPDSSRLYYSVEGLGKQGYFFTPVERTPAGEKAGAAYNAVWNIRFSPDSKRLTFQAGIGEATENTSLDSAREGFRVPVGTRALVVDGKVYKHSDSAVFSPDSTRVAWVQTLDDGGWYSRQGLVVDGAPVPGKFAPIQYVSFSPDAKHYLFIPSSDTTGLRRGDCLVIDGAAYVQDLGGDVVRAKFTGPRAVEAIVVSPEMVAQETVWRVDLTF